MRMPESGSTRLLRAFLLLCLVLAAVPSVAQEATGTSEPTAASAPEFFYVAINPAALLSFFNLGFGNALLPVALANLEYGVALSGGYAWGPHIAELRLAVGTSNSVFAVSMLQTGYAFAFACPFGLNRGLYVGGFLRLWVLTNLLTGVSDFNASPSLAFGWWIDIGRFFVDLRINQSIGVLSWSTLAHTKPAFAFMFSPLPAISPVLPTFNINFGMRL